MYDASILSLVESEYPADIVCTVQSGFAFAITVLALLHTYSSTKSIYWTMGGMKWHLPLAQQSLQQGSVVEPQRFRAEMEIILPTV